MKNKTYIQGFIQGIIEYYSILEPFQDEQSIGFDVYEINDKWMITFHFITGELKSSDPNPIYDNSETIWGKEEFKILKTESLKELALLITDKLDIINAIKIETER